MTKMIKICDLQIDEEFLNFANKEILKDLKIQENYFWEECSKLINEFNPLNKKLLEKRKSMQEKINDWHSNHAKLDFNKDEYKKFLLDIGYIVKEGSDFKIDTTNVDLEISNISGPQLVVPITNARYALNAVNARWGSLYDAIYGTNVLGSLPLSKVYDPVRGKKVIEYSKNYLDKILPLKKGKWQEVESFKIENNELYFLLSNQIQTQLNENKKTKGYKINSENKIEELIFLVNNLHIRILLNKNDPIGKNDKANISNIILESAISTILDCEDSVATVDPADKILAYQNWLGLMRGNLTTKFSKDGKIINRSINKDIKYITFNGTKKNLKSQSLMLIRNVGLLMTSSAILDKKGKEVGEGLIDAIITSAIGLYDLRKKGENKNSQENSIYIVKPKMHGPEEVSFTNDLMSKIEEILNIPKFTIKIGIMDEERRTSINLKECIRAAKSRVAFINTGFLDRTGDEIHTSMFAGPLLKKGEMKNSTWINSYEKRNVEIGLECGLQGKAQIGKGMWAMPDLMKEMLKQKINHPLH